MKRIILAILLVEYTQCAFCFVIDWNMVNLAFPKVENKDLNEYIYSIWNQDFYFAPEELEVYDLNCSLTNINVYLYREPIGTSHSVGYYILQDTSRYKALSPIALLDNVLNYKNNKLKKTKLLFLNKLASVVDQNSTIYLKKTESSYVYSVHGYAQMLRNTAQKKKSKSQELHNSIIDQWVYDNFGMLCDYNSTVLYSDRRTESLLIKIVFENNDRFCLYSKMNAESVFYNVDLDSGCIDTILLYLAEKVIAQPKLSNRKKIIYIKKAQEALIDFFGYNL